MDVLRPRVSRFDSWLNRLDAISFHFIDHIHNDVYLHLNYDWSVTNSGWSYSMLASRDSNAGSSYLVDHTPSTCWGIPLSLARNTF